MSVVQFCQLLNSLGFKPKERRKLTPEVVDWMFLTDDTIKPFLSWFCTNITEKNFLSSSELEEYALLAEAGKVLDGDELQEALRSAATVGFDSDTEQLKAEILELEAQLAASREELKELVWQRDCMRSQLQTTSRRASELHQLMRQRDKAFSSVAMPKLEKSNAALNNMLREVAESASLLVQAIAEPRVMAEQVPAFLFASSLEEYHQHDEELTKLIHHFIKKHVLTSEHISTADTPASDSLAWIQGVDAETHARQCRELARLQAFFPQYEMERIHAELELVKKRSAYDALKTQLMKQQQYAALDETTLVQRICDTKKCLLKTRQALAKNVDSTIRDLVIELAKLQSTPILWGDFNLKIARQHYFIYKQSKAISHLLSQQARHVILAVFLGMERDELLNIFTLLSSLVRVLEMTHTNYTIRMKQLDTYNQLDNSNISEDVQALQLVLKELLKNVLSTDDKTDVINLSRRLFEDIEAIRKRYQIQQQTIESKVEKTSTNVERFRQALYESASTQTPNLTSPRVAEWQQQLDTALNSLTSAMEAILKEHQIRSKKLSHASREQQIGRNLFYYFFKDTENLRTLFSTSQQRLSAQRVK